MRRSPVDPFGRFVGHPAAARAMGRLAASGAFVRIVAAMRDAPAVTVRGLDGGTFRAVQEVIPIGAGIAEDLHGDRGPGSVAA